ncbi:MAG TPA: tetratricopeptide repeat protein, partial [Polyangiaceae bacterium]|nr:tetratricopeptide repeat protein [Polyangiaceae bacterium]
MRLALVIRSSYAENTVVTCREAFLDNAQVFAERLALKDAAFELVTLDATRDLPETLERLLKERAGQLESLLVHFTGYVAVKADRGPALLLDGARLRAFPLSRLRAALEDGAQQSLVIVNGLAVVDADQPPDLVATNVGDALSSSGGSIATLVGIESDPATSRRGPLRLTDLFLLAVDHLAVKARGGLVTDNAIYQAMQSDVLSFAAIAGVDHHAGYFDFVVLHGPTVDGILDNSARNERSTKPVPTYRVPLPISPEGNGAFSRIKSEVERFVNDGDDELTPPSSASAQRPHDRSRGVRRVPTVADTPNARAAGQREWLTEAAYFPSAPPPPVGAGGGVARTAQNTLPGITTLHDEANPEQEPPVSEDIDEEQRGEMLPGEPDHTPTEPRIETEPRDEEQEPEPEQEPEQNDEDSRATGQTRPELGSEDPHALVAMYEEMLAQLDDGDETHRADVQAKLGDALRDAQRAAEALFAYERALDLDPLHSEAFEGACALYRDANDFAGLVSTIRRKIEVLEEPTERLALQDEIADIWLHDAEDYPRAILALEERLAETPGDVLTIQRMIDAYDRMQDLLGRLDAREQLAKAPLTEPELRAAAWLEAAEIAHHDLNDLARTFLLLESAVETGVLLPHALLRAEELLGGSQRWLEVVELYERALETSVVEAEAFHLAARLIALIHEQSCQDAIKPETLSRLVQLADRNAELAEATVTLVESVTQGAETLELLQRLRAAQPRNLELLHQVVNLAQVEHPDVATNLSSVILALGAATEQEVELAKVLSTDTLPTPSRPLEHADYESLLFPPDLDREMTLGLSRLEKTLISAGAFERKDAPSVPKDAAVVDPETSTITFARSFLWTSRLLSTQAPELVLLADAPTLFRFVPQQPPRLLVSRSLGSGFTLPELVFLVGRQAAIQLPGLLARGFFDDPRSFGALLYALGVVSDQRKHGIKALADSEQKLGKRLLAQLESDPSLDADVDRVVGTETPSLEDCERRATQWMRSVDQG